MTDFRRIFPRKSGSRLETTGSTCGKKGLARLMIRQKAMLMDSQG